VTFNIILMKMSQNFPEDAGQNLQVMILPYTIFQNWPKSSSGKVLIPYVIRMTIKFSCAVPDIDQLILLLSIPKMQNLARKRSGFEPESILIIISCGLMHIEKRGNGLQVTHTA